jgi:AraC-like DNA-binding protein
LRDTTARDFRRALAEARALSAAGGNGFSAALDEGRLALRLEEAILLAARELISRSDLSAGGVWGVEDAARYVAQHCQEEFRLADLVSKCATNPGDFCRRFKELTGSPLFEFINRERVRRACELLKRADTPITEIALSVGYKNIGFFNRYFLRVTGMNPSDFRKKV